MTTTATKADLAEALSTPPNSPALKPVKPPAKPVASMSPKEYRAALREFLAKNR